MTVPGADDSALTQDETRAVQLAILDDIDRFCREHGIVYFLWAGTLLGAVRHQGYIPWDDDIDLALPRPDYERFLREYSAADTGPFRLFDQSTHATYGYPFARVADERTRVVENARITVPTGLFVDVFPLDGWPADTRAARFHRTRLKAVHRAIALWGAKVRPGRSRSRTAKNLVIRLKRPIIDRLPIRAITGALVRIAKSQPYDDGADVGVTVSVLIERMDRSAYGEPVDIEFEGRTLRAGPADHDRVLRRLYGDYMVLPSEADRAARYRHFVSAYRVSD